LDAANGALAWEIAKEYPGIIHLLITDIVMPHMGGIELAEHVILQRPDIGLIFVSGYAPGKYAAPFHTAGRTANVQKPYKTSEFLGVVRQMLDAMSLP
jgi:YesN/AraC family two-component response regulator